MIKKKGQKARTISKWELLLISLIGLLLLFPFSLNIGVVNVEAAEVIVTKTDDTNDRTCDSDCSLREAIDTANSGDTITIPPGIYTLPLGQLEIDKNLTLNGAGSEITILQAHESLLSANHRVLLISDSDVTIAGVTIQKGSTDSNGGGILNEGGNLVINNSLIDNNFALDNGGGIFNNEGELNITGSTISNNIAMGKGGGIFGINSSIEVTDSIINDNFASLSGGGILVTDSELVIKNSTIDTNASALGGGIHNVGFATIDNSTITNNFSIFSDNDEIEQSGNGGGITNMGELNITNSTMAYNFAVESGGSISNHDGELNIINSTITDNFAFMSGGGIFNNPTTTTTFTNTIIAHNIPENCNGGASLSNGHNLSTDDSCGLEEDGDQQDVAPLLGEFINSEVPGQGHFPLLDDSPAIDAGNDGFCFQFDQLGNSRVVDIQGIGESICDIGAIEFFPFPIENVNNLLTLDGFITNFDNRPTPDAPAGVFTISATFTNTSSSTIDNLFFEVAELTRGNKVLNAFGGPGGVGAIVIPHDRLVLSGESVTVDFEIGLKVRAAFVFFVDLYAAQL